MTSDAEEQFISTNIPSALRYAFVLGGYQDTTAPDYSEPTGGWRWVTGEPWGYTDWYPGEPTDDGGSGPENYLGFYAPYGHWNDTDNGLNGYVVEYESYPYLFHYDFDGDGKADLVFQNQTTNQIVFWFLNGTQVIGGAMLPQTPVNGYKVVGVGDFNGDGQLDLMFQNTSSGTLTAWFLNGTNFIGGLGVTALPPTGWQVKGIADYNSDGHQDLMLQNQTSGQVMLWYMNGVNLLSSGTLSATPAANYQIVGPR